jgi:hypothetical protein
MTCCPFSYFSFKTKSADIFLINARINGVMQFMAEAAGLFMLVIFIMTSWFRRFLEWVVVFLGMCSWIDDLLYSATVVYNVMRFPLNVSDLRVCCGASCAIVLLNCRLTRWYTITSAYDRILYSCGWVFITNCGVFKSWSIRFNRVCFSYQHVIVSPNIINCTFKPCNLWSWNIVENSTRVKCH